MRAGTVKLLAVTGGVTVCAMVGGAWLAAPDEIGWLAGELGRDAAARAEVALGQAGAVVGAAGTAAADWWNAVGAPRLRATGPRGWAAGAAGLLSLGFAIGAWRHRRAGGAAAVATTRAASAAPAAGRPRTPAVPAPVAARGPARSRLGAGLPGPVSLGPLRGLAAARRGERAGTPRAVLALADAGRSPEEIARRTGLSRDAVALCLAMAPSRTAAASNSA